MQETVIFGFTRWRDRSKEPVNMRVGYDETLPLMTSIQNTPAQAENHKKGLLCLSVIVHYNSRSAPQETSNEQAFE